MVLFYVSAILVVVAPAVDNEKKTSFGFRMGVGYNTFWNVAEEENVLGLASINGLNEMQGIWTSMGGSLRIPVAGDFWIRPGFYMTYQSKTGSVSVQIGEVDDPPEIFEIVQQMGHLTIKQILLDVPLVLRYQAASGFFVEAGPQLTVNLSSEMDYSIFKVAVDNLVRDYIFSGALFVGTTFQVGSGFLEIGTGVALSITNLITDELQIPGIPLAVDGSMLLNPKDLVVQFEMTYWFM